MGCLRLSDESGGPGLNASKEVPTHGLFETSFSLLPAFVRALPRKRYQLMGCLRLFFVPPTIELTSKEVPTHGLFETF